MKLEDILKLADLLDYITTSLRLDQATYVVESHKIDRLEGRCWIKKYSDSDIYCYQLDGQKSDMQRMLWLQTDLLEIIAKYTDPSTYIEVITGESNRGTMLILPKKLDDVDRSLLARCCHSLTTVNRNMNTAWP